MSVDSIGDLVVRLGFDPTGLDAGASAIEKRLEQTGTKLYFMGSRISAGFSAPLGIAVGLISKFGMEFNQAMTESLAIMDDVTPQLRKKMEDQARAVSETSKFGAAEAAKAYYSLASAGLSAAQATEALPVVTRFAMAGVMDLAHASESLAGVQASLGLKTNDAAQNMLNMTRVSDVLVKVNNLALGNVKDFTAALERSGGSLRLYNKSIEEGAAVLGAYAEKGIQGANAGQQLYMILRDLTSAAVKQPEHFQKAGIAVFDASGKMRNMADIMADMEKKFDGLTDKGKRTELAFLGLTSRSQNALLPLIGMSSKIRELQGALEDAGGTTDLVAGKQMLSLQNQLIQLKNRFGNVASELFDRFIPAIQTHLIPLAERLLVHLKGWADWLGTLSDRQKFWIMSITAGAIALGPMIMMMGSFLITVRALIEPIGLLAAGLKALSTGSAMAGAGGLIPLLANPYVLGGAAIIAGLAVAFYQLHSMMARFETKPKTGQYIDETVITIENAAKKLEAINAKMPGMLPGFTSANGMPITVLKPGEKATSGSSQPDAPVAPRSQNIFDRISGKTALQDARDWATAIKQVGGVSKMASADIDAAGKVFETAMDRIAKSGKTGGKEAQEFGKIWLDLMRSVDNDKGFAAIDKITKVGLASSMATGLPGYDMSELAYIKDRANFGPKARSVEAQQFGYLDSGKIPGFTSAAELRKGIVKDTTDKDWKAAISGMSTLSNEFAKLAQIAGGSFGNIARQIGEMLTMTTMAGKSGINLKTGWADLRKGGDSLMDGLTNIATGAMGVAGAFMAATNNASQTKNVLGGIQTGAAAGAAFGPWGAAIGAAIGGIAAVIKGKPEWAKLADDIGRDLGVEITEEMAKAMEADSKKFGRQATMSLHLKDLVDAAGGLNSSNLEKFTHTLRDTFSMLETGAISVEQTRKVMDENFAEFAKAGTDAYGFLSEGIQEMIQLNDQFGVGSKAIAEYLQGQGRAAMEGWNATVGGILPTYTALHDKVTAAQEALDKYNVSGKAGTEEHRKLAADLAVALVNEKAAAGGARQELADLGIVAVASFSAAVAAGVPWLEALKQIAPQARLLWDTFKNLGLEVDNVGVRSLLMQASILDKNPELMTAVSGLGATFAALANMGVLNEETFRSMERTGMAMYSKLQSAVAAHGGSTRDALVPMQDYLHRAQKAAEELGIPLDDNTQMLIDQSKELGIWKEAGKTATDKLIDGMSTLVDRVKDLINSLNGIPTNVNSHVTVTTHHVNTGDVSTELPGMAVGGIVTGPTPLIAGEAGPEAIIPLKQLKQMLGSGLGNGQPMTVVVQVDGREIARTAVEYMPGVLRSHGLFT